MNLKHVVGYEGLYLVSECGKVFRTDGDEVSQVETGTPKYKYVNLRKGKDRKLVRVHRLVATAFIPQEEGKDCVDHIDRDKFNNHASNLRWCTRAENSRNMSNNIKVNDQLLKDIVMKEFNNLSPFDYISKELKSNPDKSYEEVSKRYRFFNQYGWPKPEIGSVNWFGENVRIEQIAAIHSKRYTDIWRQWLKYDKWKSSHNVDDWINVTLEAGVVVCGKTIPQIGRFTKIGMETLKTATSSGKTVKEIQEKDYKEVIVDGIIYRGTIPMLCKVFGQDESKVRARMGKQGMSLEESLTTKTLRVKKWIVDGKVMKTNEMCEILNIKSKSFNKKHADGLSVQELKEYFKIEKDITPVL